MTIRKLRLPRRTAVNMVVGLGAIVTGLWLIVATLFGMAIGGGAGLVLSGLALLLIEALSDPPDDRGRR
ncbi:hypothetical protein [Actinosynnema sp. NPDC023587]|uniref:hypothetical protein n=1 Tax=Actinosynnema sp. NPDC023587 TaxID=3154695 RepID=UPI0033FAFFDD